MTLPRPEDVYKTAEAWAAKLAPTKSAMGVVFKFLSPGDRGAIQALWPIAEAELRERDQSIAALEQRITELEHGLTQLWTRHESSLAEASKREQRIAVLEKEVAELKSFASAVRWREGSSL